jgi:ABC-type uncharacterized transport system YnjBCD substrate-binding protein
MEGDTETGLSEIGIQLAEDRVYGQDSVNKTTYLRVAQELWKFLTRRKLIEFSRRTVHR